MHRSDRLDERRRLREGLPRAREQNEMLARANEAQAERARRKHSRERRRIYIHIKFT